VKTEREGSLNRPKDGCGWRHGRKGSVSRAALSAHSKTLFYGYARASLRLRTANFLKKTPKNRETRWYPTLLSPQRLVRCSCNLFYGSMRRIMRSCLIGVHKANDPVPSNSDYIPVVSTRCHHNNCSRSHGIPPLRASLTPSLTAQQFRLDHGVLCSVPWKHSSRTLSTIASVPELARAAGRQRTRISRYVAYSVVVRGPE
jgi:hypothetical protein